MLTTDHAAATKAAVRQARIGRAIEVTARVSIALIFEALPEVPMIVTGGNFQPLQHSLLEVVRTGVA